MAADVGMIRCHVPDCRPQTLVEGSRRWVVARLLAREEGAGVGELLEAFGLPQDSTLAPLHRRLGTLARAKCRPIRRVGRGRWARYFWC